MFLGCLKVTTIFIFVFFTLVVAPAHYYAEDEPEWVAPAGKLMLRSRILRNLNEAMSSKTTESFFSQKLI